MKKETTVRHHEHSFFYGYIVVSAAFLTMVLAWGANRTFGVFLEPMLSEFGWTRAGISGPFTLSVIITGLLGPVAGRMSDRYGPRRVVITCALFIGTGYLLTSFVSNIWHLYLSYGVMGGIGLSGAVAPLVSTVSRWFVKRRGTMTGIVMAGASVGITTVPLGASWLISSYGWRISYFVVGCFVLVLLIIGGLFLKREPREMGLRPYGDESRQAVESSPRLPSANISYRKILGDRMFWVLSMLFFIGNFNVNIIMVHIVVHATGMGVSSIVAAGVLSLTAGISVAGRIVAGWAADRIGSELALIIGFTLMLMAFLVLLISSAWWMLYVFGIIFGLGGWASATIISVAVAEHFGTESHGTVFSTVLCLSCLGGATGPLLAGFTFDTSGSYRLAFIISATLSAASIVLVLLRLPSGSRRSA